MASNTSSIADEIGSVGNTDNASNVEIVNGPNMESPLERFPRISIPHIQNIRGNNVLHHAVKRRVTRNKNMLKSLLKDRKEKMNTKNLQQIAALCIVNLLEGESCDDLPDTLRFKEKYEKLRYHVSSPCMQIIQQEFKEQRNHIYCVDLCKQRTKLYSKHVKFLQRR